MHCHRTKRIIGGVKTDIDSVPYVVLIRQRKIHYCGGSIISKDWVLTAAHCTQAGTPEDYKVRVGSRNRKNGGELIKVKEIINHENHSTKLLCFNDDCSVSDESELGDVSLVRLEKSITFSKN